MTDGEPPDAGHLPGRVLPASSLEFTRTLTDLMGLVAAIAVMRPPCARQQASMTAAVLLIHLFGIRCSSLSRSLAFILFRDTGPFLCLRNPLWYKSQEIYVYVYHSLI